MTADSRAAATGATVRAFFAFWPDTAARDALARLARVVAAAAGGRGSAGENVHLTLAFLGEVPIARVPVLQAIGAAVAASVGGFDLRLGRVGMFRGSGIAWAGASAPPPDLVRLVTDLNAALAADGFAVDPRPFHVHVTLARRCRRRAEVALPAPIAWTVTRLVLNASDLSSGGPRHRELAAWPLRPPTERAAS